MDAVYNWHRLVYNFLRLPMSIATRVRYGFRFGRPLKLPNPYIVVANHTTYWDQFLVGLSFAKHMYFLASEHSFRMGLQSLFMKAMAAPIGRVKGSTDASATLGMIRRLKSGKNMCFFPEGERSFDGRTADLHPSTAKLLRTAGVPVVTFRLKGGYLADPRWAKKRRRGNMRGQVVRVYQPEELKKMSVAEIHDSVLADIYEDAWETQRSEMFTYKGKRLAEGLEEALFICPECGGVDTMSGKGNVFSCSCGMRAEITDKAFFAEGAPFETIADWDDWQRGELAARVEKGGEIFSDEGAWLASLGDGHKLERVAQGRLALTEDAITIGDKSFPVAELSDFALCHGKKNETIMFTAGGVHYELGLDGAHSRRKYALAERLLLAKERKA